MEIPMSMLWSFFFSSRRRHTRCSRDWSSDVCSSDLLGILHVEEHFAYNGREEARLVYGTDDPRHPGAQYQLTRGDVLLAGPVDLIARQIGRAAGRGKG